MRIASYNIRKAVGLDWRRDAERILDVIAEIEADVVVLQEADRRLGTRAGVLPLEQVQQRLGMIPADVAALPHSHGWHGNAIFCKDDHDISHARRIVIPSLEPRGAISVKMENPGIEIIGVHFGLTPGMRRKQASHLARHISETPHPVVIAGDFNTIRVDNGAFGPDARTVTPGPSFHAARPTAALDRFVLSGPAVDVSSHVHQSPLAKRASDHLPVVLDLAFDDAGD